MPIDNTVPAITNIFTEFEATGVIPVPPHICMSEYHRNVVCYLATKLSIMTSFAR